MYELNETVSKCVCARCVCVYATVLSHNIITIFNLVYLTHREKQA